jgi:hypothetical protein
MPAYWEGLPPGTSEVATSVVATAERALGLLAEEAALRRNRPRMAAANRSPRAGGRDEAATAVETASKGQGDRRGRPDRGSGRGPARRGRTRRGHGQQHEQQGPEAQR